MQWTSQGRKAVNYLPALRGIYGASNREVSCPLLLKASAITALSNKTSESIISAAEFWRPKVSSSSGRNWGALSQRFFTTY